jgi:hypothetical protein
MQEARKRAFNEIRVLINEKPSDPAKLDWEFRSISVQSVF